MATPDATADGGPAHRRTRDRAAQVLTAAATVMALWFGLTAPSTSPVSAAPAAVTAPAASTHAPAGAGGGPQVAVPDGRDGGEGR